MGKMLRAQGIGCRTNERYETCMSMTKMREENSDREAPRESRVMLPGQSHISRGMTVLLRIEERSGATRVETRGKGTDSYRCLAIREVGSRKKVCLASTSLKRNC